MQRVRGFAVQQHRRGAAGGRAAPLGVAEQPGDRAAVAGEGVAGDAPAAFALPLAGGPGGHVEEDQVQRAAPARGVPGEPPAYPALRTAVVDDDGGAGAQEGPEPEVVGGPDQGAVDGVRE